MWRDPALRRWNLWGYIDEHDSALACRLALEADLSGARSFIIAATDTVLDRPPLEMLKQYYPDVPVTREIGEYETRRRARSWKASRACPGRCIRIESE